MQLIRGTAPEPSPFPARRGAWRMRPGEVPTWIELPLDRAAIDGWRSRAREAGLGVDAWLGLLVECELVRAHLAGLESGIAEVTEEARRSLEVSRLAPTPSLRQWAAQLAGQGSQPTPPPDELPSAVLPERLLAQIVPAGVADFATAAVQGDAEDEALALERAATAAGLTMEAWAYRTALRLTASDAA